MMGLMIVVVAVVIPKGSLLPRVCHVQPCYADIQVFIQLLLRFYLRLQQDCMLLTLILKTSLSIDSSTSAAQIVVKYDRIDNVGSNGGNGDGKLVKKLSKVEKPQRPKKSTKTIGSEKPSF